MIKVLTTGTASIVYYTADTTVYTADSTVLTADLISEIISLGDDHTLKVPFRFFTTDVNLFLKNELTQVETTIPLTATQVDGMMVVSFPFVFEEGDSYESNITDSSTDELIWRGRIYVTDQEDLQNFNILLPNTSNGKITI